MGDYWTRTLRRRISRRRALMTAGGAATAAAFLAACGGDEETPAATGPTGGGTGATSATGATGSTQAPQPTADTSASLLNEPIDTTSTAVRGGTWSTSINADPPHFDSTGRYNNLAYAQNALAYSILVTLKPFNVAQGETYPLWEFEPEAVEGWEYSGDDGLTLVWKLRENLNTDPRPPTNGRVLDSADVDFSWQKFAEFSPRRAEIINEFNPNAAVESVSYPDERTVVWQLAFPSPVLFQKLHRFQLLTREGDETLADGYDPLTTMRGSGPWMQMEYEPSVRVVYERNPNYWNADFPLLDRLEGTIIPRRPSAKLSSAPAPSITASLRRSAGWTPSAI